MFLLVARSVAVYASTAFLCLWLVHRFVRPVPRGIAFALALTPFLLTGYATWTGAVYAPLDIVYDTEPFKPLRTALGIGQAQTPLLGDVVYMEIPWRKAVRASIEHGELPLWNPAVLAGEPLLAVQQPVVLHPATWIGLLLPLAQAWTFEMSLRLLLALLCAWIFLRDLGCRDVPALFGASAWALSNYFVFFLGYPHSTAVAPFPLLLAGLRRLAREPGRRAAALVTAALILMLTAGHPESVLHAVCAAGLYFVFELSAARREDVPRALAYSIGAGALALGLAAVLLLPLAEALPHTFEHAFRKNWYAHAARSLPWRDVWKRLALEASPLALSSGVDPQRISAPFGPTGYAGSLLLPLAAVGLAGRNRARYFFAALGLLGLSLGTLSPTAAVLARLPLFDIAINDRLIFVTAFSLCVLAALGIDRLVDGEGRRVLAIAAALTLGGLMGMFRERAPHLGGLGISVEEARTRASIQLVPVAAVPLLAVAFRARSRARWLPPALLFVLVVERRLETGRLYASVTSQAFYPRLEVLEKIPRGEPHRVVALGYTFIPNVAAIYDLEDVRGYEAMTFHPLFDTYPMWCVHQPVWYNRVDDPTTPFLAFLNVRWVLTPLGAPVPDGWKVLTEADGMRLLENPKALPRAFVPKLVFSEPDPARRLALMKTIPDFREGGVVSEAGGPSWEPNGAAEVRIRGYGRGRLDLEVEAREPTVVGTSVTAWPGWRARLDGQPIRPLSYNHAFLGFRVPAGRHSLGLRYTPTSFAIGAAISAASLVLVVILSVRARKTSPPQPT